MIIRKKTLNNMVEKAKQLAAERKKNQQGDSSDAVQEEFIEVEEDNDYKYQDDPDDDDEFLEDSSENNVEDSFEGELPENQEEQEDVNSDELAHLENVEDVSELGSGVYVDDNGPDEVQPQEQIDDDFVIGNGDDSQYDQNVEQSVSDETVYIADESENAGIPQISQKNEEETEPQKEKKKQASLDEEIVNIFDLDNIDFSQRQERRRGDRRRGFRRVDDRNLVSRAREEADGIRESAMKEGYQSGLEQAQADIEFFKESIADFMNSKQAVFDHIAPDILDISVDIARKIINKEIGQSPEVLFNTVVDVLKTLSKEETKVTLRVNPTEVNPTREAVSELINIAGIDTKVVVLSDEDVSEGGCLVTTTNGIVDATVESRLGVILQVLRES